MKRSILLFLIAAMAFSWGCADVPYKGAAASPAPASEQATSPTEPLENTLQSKPMEKRVYLKEFDPPGNSLAQIAFSGEPLSLAELVDFAEATGWEELHDCMQTFGAVLAPIDWLTINGQSEASHYLNGSRIEAISGQFTAVIVDGMLYGDMVKLILVLYQQGEKYLPYHAVLYGGAATAEPYSFLEAGGDLWLILETVGLHGTGYYEVETIWYNITKKALALCYISHFNQACNASSFSNAPVTKNVYCFNSFSTREEHMTEYESGAFSMDIVMNISLIFDYYDDDWEGEDDWRDTFEKEIVYTLYYDPAEMDFYIAEEQAQLYLLRAGHEDEME